MRYEINRAQVIVFTTLMCIGCKTPVEADKVQATVASTKDAGVSEAVLGRAGAVMMELPEYRQAISEARALQEWRSGKPADLSALDQMMLRRRVLTKALETRVVRAEAQRRQLTPDVRILEALIAQAARGLPPALERARTTKAELLGSEETERRLAKRFGPLAPHVRQAAMDIIEAGLLADALLDEIPLSRIRRDWKQQNTRIVLDLIKIPRVPTTIEISRAVKSMQPEMKRYHERESKYFRKPARVFVRRMALAWPDEATDADKASTRALADRLRARIKAGEDMISLVREFGAKQDHRSGGKFTIKEAKRPDLYAMKKGGLSPNEELEKALIFFRVEGRAPEMNRPFTDSRVQREIAAALLRESDTLPEARRQANEAARLLGEAPKGDALTRLVKSNRFKRVTTPEFSEARGNAVPTIGLAPELFKHVFELTTENAVSPVVSVRQDYVVARLIKRTTGTADAWREEEADYVQKWKNRSRPRMVDEFLNKTLKGQALWIDMKRLEALSREQLMPKKSASLPTE